MVSSRPHRKKLGLNLQLLSQGIALTSLAWDLSSPNVAYRDTLQHNHRFVPLERLTGRVRNHSQGSKTFFQYHRRVE